MVIDVDYGRRRYLANELPSAGFRTFLTSLHRVHNLYDDNCHPEPYPKQSYIPVILYLPPPQMLKVTWFGYNKDTPWVEICQGHFLKQKKLHPESETVNEKRK